MGSSLKTSIQSTRDNSHLHSSILLKMVDEAKVKYVCDIYDWDGKGEIDLFFLGDISRWLMRLRLNTSATSTIGTAKVRSISSSLETSATPSASTSPRRPVLDRDRLMRRARNSPSTMMLSRRSRPLLPPLTPRDPTTTMLSSSSSTTKTATAP